MFMDGFKDNTMRADIKKVLDCDDAIAFIDFERGKTSGYIRFKEENAVRSSKVYLSMQYPKRQYSARSCFRSLETPSSQKCYVT